MIEFIQNNWLAIGTAIGSVVTVASLIAKYTPNTVDDKIVAVLLKLVNFLALNKPKA